MPLDSNWLQQTTGITEGSPYQSALVAVGDGEHHSPGIAVFHVENGVVRFEFYVDHRMDRTDYLALLKAAAASMQGARSLEIEVPSENFRYNAVLTTLPTGLPHSGGPLRGLLADPTGVATSSFGGADRRVNSVVVELLDLPSSWGDWELTYQHATTRSKLEFTEDETHILVPVRSLGLRALSGCTIQDDGWTVEVQEIPSERRDDPRVTHWCSITRSDGQMTGSAAWEFFNEELLPFLCFVFGHNVQASSMTGVGWTKLRAVRPENIRTYGNNWFLSTGARRVDLQALFQVFHSQPAETKKHWCKVIDKYAESEEIIATLGNPETAETVSFSGLDGLVRSIISGYPEKDQWLDNRLQLKSNWRKDDGGRAGIVDAIEMVLKRELGTKNPKLAESLSRLAKLRNSTSHTDLRSDPDWSDAYHRWNASQALIEILLLSKLGLKEIPNRTEYPRLQIMGVDVYKNVRNEAILPRRCQSCGEWTGTLNHEECEQILCAPCWEQHNRTGCTEAVFPPTQ